MLGLAPRGWWRRILALSSNDRLGSPTWRRLWQGFKRSGIKPQPTVPSARWREALAAADEALAAIGNLAASEPGRRLEVLARERSPRTETQAERDRKLVEELASLRTSLEQGHMGQQAVKHGSRLHNGPSNATGWIWRRRRRRTAVARLKSRPEAFVREVIGSLDHWLSVRHDLGNSSEKEQRTPRSDENNRTRVRALDTDPERNRLRALLKEADLKLQLHSRSAPSARQTKLFEFGPSTALLLARVLNQRGGRDRTPSPSSVPPWSVIPATCGPISSLLRC